MALIAAGRRQHPPVSRRRARRTANRWSRIRRPRGVRRTEGSKWCCSGDELEMEVFRPFLAGRAIAALIAVALLMPIIYLFAPLVNLGGFRPLESELNRVAVCAVLFVLCLIVLWIVRPPPAEARLQPDAGCRGRGSRRRPRRTEEEAELRDKLTNAMAALRKATCGKGGFLYDQPWYVIIGPPGSGKTTALANSGLEFPLSRWRQAAGCRRHPPLRMVADRPCGADRHRRALHDPGSGCGGR